jgi:hypothetical protein
MCTRSARKATEFPQRIFFYQRSSNRLATMESRLVQPFGLDVFYGEKAVQALGVWPMGDPHQALPLRRDDQADPRAGGQ